ncbi:MAG: MerR family transcriptional regulator [Bacteroidaceae bacterium]|nr:MerR family transcriptional regulator [Bacteroidaceae bacterium]
MALNTNKNLKKYYSIKEVSDIIGVPASTLRYWEQEFDEINPKKSSGGVRQYTQADIERIKLVNHLVREKGMTINGARNSLHNNPKATVDNHEIVSRLKAVRAELEAICRQLDATPPCGQPL